jgi:hypothetical protein
MFLTLTFGLFPAHIESGQRAVPNSVQAAAPEILKRIVH